MGRLILRTVDVETLATGKRAVVTLELSGKAFSSHRQLGESQFLFKTVSQTTLDAVNEVLFSRVKAKIDFKLLHAEELKPDFLNRSLFIVALEASLGHLTLHLIGTVVADSHEWARGIASATLDASNRLITHLLQLEGTV